MLTGRMLCAHMDTMGRLAWEAWEGFDFSARALWCSCESFTDSHSPRPGLLHRWCDHIWVKACSSVILQTVSVLRQHHQRHRRRSKRPFGHPHPVLSSYHTLHMWKDFPPNPHHSCQHTQVPYPTRWLTQVNKVSQMLCFIHHSPKCQDTNYNHKIECTIMENYLKAHTFLTKAATVTMQESSVYEHCI